MSVHKGLPTVVIVGRANVGKSTLFNRFSSDMQSMTYDVPGVTRDIVSDVVVWDDNAIRLTDTGGISLSKSKDPINEEVRQRALGAIEGADVVLFVIDGAVGVLSEDREIAKVVRKQAKKVFLVLNKIDLMVSREYMHEGNSLGFTVFGVSAAHGRGIDELKAAILHEVAGSSIENVAAPKYRVAIIGKPNVGKSSLMNLLLKKERTIVADMPGTTREAISDVVTFYQEDIRITDTPGIRRKRGVTQPLEQMMVKSALRAIDAAHIVLLVVDGASGDLSDQEVKLAFYAFEEKHKALIVIFNKQDLMTEEHKVLLERETSLYNHLLDKVATITISCETGKNVGKVIPLIHTVWERSNQQIPDSELTIFFNELLAHRPLYKSGTALTFRRAQQIRVAPITIQLVVGHPPFWERTQLGFFDNQLRKKYDLKGAPIAFVLRKS
jgi:GTPase